MKDLTSDARTGAKAFLVPSSMSAGNTVAADPVLAMTAPGSPSVLPVPEAVDRLPQPTPSDTGRPSPLPLNWPRREGEHAGLPPVPSGDAADLWRPAGDRPSGTWRPV